MQPIRTKAQKTKVLLATTIWRTLRYRPPFRPSTGSHAVSSFQLTFRLLCLLTDCPSAIGVPCGSLTASCDAHVCFPASPGSWCAASPPRHAEALVSRFASCPAFVLAEPGALPGYSRLLSMRNRWIYVMRRTGNWRTSGCVAPSSPCIPPTIHLRGVSSPAYSVRPACPPLDGGRGGQVGPHLRLRLPQGRLADETFAIGYPSPLPSWVPPEAGRQDFDLI